MAITPTAVDHGITITTSPREDGVPFTWPWRAQCLRGWQSPAVPTRPHAVAEGHAHTVGVAQGAAPVEQDPTYVDRVAAAVAERICNRGVVLDVDELATVAMALDCSASDLLPPHLMSDEQVQAESAERGLIWDDEAGTVLVRRLPWMSDEQRATVREGMLAWFREAGFVQDGVHC